MKIKFLKFITLMFVGLMIPSLRAITPQPMYEPTPEQMEYLKNLPPPTEEELKMAEDFLKVMEEADPEFVRKLEEESMKLLEKMGIDPYAPPQQYMPPSQPAPKPVPKAEVKQGPKLKNKAEIKKTLESLSEKISSVRQKASGEDKLAKIIEVVQTPLEDMVYYIPVVSKDEHLDVITEDEFNQFFDHAKELEKQLAFYEPQIKIEEMKFREEPPKKGTEADRLFEEIQREKNETTLEKIVKILTSKPSSKPSSPDNLINGTVKHSEKILKKYEPEALKKREAQKAREGKAKKDQDEKTRSRTSSSSVSASSPGSRGPGGSSSPSYSPGYSDYSPYGGGYSPDYSSPSSRGSYGSGHGKKPSEGQGKPVSKGQPTSGSGSANHSILNSSRSGEEGELVGMREALEDTLSDWVANTIENNMKNFEELFSPDYLSSPSTGASTPASTGATAPTPTSSVTPPASSTSTTPSTSSAATPAVTSPSTTVPSAPTVKPIKPEYNEPFAEIKTPLKKSHETVKKWAAKVDKLSAPDKVKREMKDKLVKYYDDDFHKRTKDLHKMSGNYKDDDVHESKKIHSEAILEFKENYDKLKAEIDKLREVVSQQK